VIGSESHAAGKPPPLGLLPSRKSSPAAAEGFLLRAFNSLLPFVVILIAITGRQVFSKEIAPRKQR
jgi:hypothetical protein